MKTLSATEASSCLDQVLDEIAATGEPVQVVGRRTSAILVPVARWRALEDTAYLHSIPGMADSIKEGLTTPVGDCVDADLARAYDGEADALFAEIEDLIDAQSWPSDEV